VWLTESGKYAVAWKEAMIEVIRAECECVRWPGPVFVDTGFLFERAGTQADMPWPIEQRGVYAHGDEDKLRRNVLDALTQSGLILDDSQVVGGHSMKRFCRDGERQGVLITVRPAGALG
jgi:Holliday junction resolvase RusA-like endonuclease